MKNLLFLIFLPIFFVFAHEIFAQKEQKAEGKLVGFHKTSAHQFEIIIRDEQSMGVASYEAKKSDAFIENLEKNFAQLRDTKISFFYEAYDEKTSSYYKGLYLRNASEGQKNETSGKPNVYGANDKTNVFWNRTGDTYNIYDAGKEVFGTSCSWFNDVNLVIYSPEKKVHYYCKDYKTKSQGDLHEAEMVVSGDLVCSRTGNTYWIFVKGKIPYNTKSSWANDDLLVYDFDTKTNWLLKNYRNMQDYTFTSDIETVSVGAQACWMADEKYYSLYIEGEFVADKLTSSYVGNDLLVYRAKTNKSYLLKDYAKNSDKKFRTAREM